LKLRLIGREVDMSLARTASLVLVIVGVVFLAMAVDAHSSIMEIGETNDPILSERVSGLQDERDAYVVCAVGFVFLGLFGFFTLVEESYPKRIAEDQLTSGARVARDVARGLSLSGNASYLPALHGLTKERLFLPAVSGDSSPPSAATDDMNITPGRDGSTPGMLLEPPGLGLLDSIEEDHGIVISESDIETVEGNLQVLKQGLDVFKDFHFKERDGKTILRVEYRDLRAACKIVRREMPDTCRQVACIGCSCLLTAAARATNKVVTVEQVDNAEDVVVFTLRLSDW
jgi:hypothetical protein